MRLLIQVTGRPAPQGSKSLGGAGQVLEQSPYLDAWRQRVKIGTFEAYKLAGVDPRRLPLFPLGVAVEFEVITFRMIKGEQCGAAESDLPLGKPDVDKLLRSTLDALGGRTNPRHTARLFADDSQVNAIRSLTKIWAVPGVTEPGATLIVSDGRD